MEEEKVIVFDPHDCTGCMRCATTCSTYNMGATSLTKSCIHVARHEGHAITHIDEEDDLVFQALTCQQCEIPVCQKVCPSGAIERNRSTGAITVNHDRCIRCKMCMDACPFGAILYNPNKRQVIKCELCGGDPQCVKFCPTGALQFLPKRLAHLPKRGRLAKRMTQPEAKVGELSPI